MTKLKLSRMVCIATFIVCTEFGTLGRKGLGRVFSNAHNCPCRPMPWTAVTINHVMNSYLLFSLNIDIIITDYNTSIVFTLRKYLQHKRNV